MKARPWTVVVGLVMASAVAWGQGCSASDASSFEGVAGGDGRGPTGGGDADNGADEGGSRPRAPEPPPERELESLFKAPVATSRYVWVTNPTSGRVAYVDAATLAVRTVEAGNGPTYLAAVPHPTEDVAVVLNVLSEDATLLAVTPNGLRARTFKTARGANAWAVSNDGKWAVAWTDAQFVRTARKEQGFQDVTVIDLTDTRAPKVLAVGYRPMKVTFSSDGTRVFAVTQDGITILRVDGDTGPRAVRNIAIDRPNEAPTSRDVSFTPDGAYALIRREGSKVVTIVSLTDEVRTDIELAAPVTDLDLSEAGDRAVAVMRSTSAVAVLPIPGIASSAQTLAEMTVSGETIGSVALAQDGTSGLLFTNASAVERITVLKLTEPPSYRTVRLYSPVLAVFPTRDARHAIVLHDLGTNSASTGAFSIVPTGDVLPAKIVSTDGPLTQVAVAPTSDAAFVLERNDTTKIHAVHLARMPSLEVTRYPLASPPTAVGIVAGARRAWIAQEHPEGRLTFVDLDSGKARTLTGFELAARIVDGSGQGGRP
jgi:hypothetical protein